MARGDSINSLLQMQAYRRAEMEGQIAKRDVYGETKNFVETWRRNNGLEGTKALPPRNEVPFQWMLPFLDKVETDDTVPSPLLAGKIPPGKGGSPGQPYDPPQPTGPYVPAPNRLAHHTGGKHFTEPSIDELIQGIIDGDIPKGTLGDEETEDRMIQEYLQEQNQAMNDELLIASHDRPLWRTPPAPGSGAANADNLADDLLIKSVMPGGLIKGSSPRSPLGL